MEGEVVQVEALEDEAVEHPAPAGQGAAEGLQQDAELLDVDAERGGQVLVDEGGRGGAAQLRTVEAVDQEPHDQHERVEDGQNRPAVHGRAAADVGQAEEPHGAAHGLGVLDDRARDVDEGEAHDHDREGRCVADEERHEPADQRAESKARQQREPEGQLQARDHVGRGVARDRHVGDHDEVQVGHAVGHVERPAHEDVDRRDGQEVVERQRHGRSPTVSGRTGRSASPGSPPA